MAGDWKTGIDDALDEQALDGMKDLAWSEAVAPDRGIRRAHRPSLRLPHPAHPPPPMSTTLWGLHAGKYGDADELFLQHNRIALGWPDMGDLAPLAPTRDAFKQRLASVYPGKSKGYVPTAAGQLFRFVHEMKPGDYVVYPSKQSRTVHIGRITGDYGHDPSGLPAYPNRRAVQWLAE